MLPCTGNGVGASFGTKLAEDILQVKFYRMFRHVEEASDLLIRAAIGKLVEDLALA